MSGPAPSRGTPWGVLGKYPTTIKKGARGLPPGGEDVLCNQSYAHNAVAHMNRNSKSNKNRADKVALTTEL